VNTRESGSLYRSGRRFGLRRRLALGPVRLSSSEVPPAQPRWLLPGALGVLVVGVLAGGVLALLGLPFGGGATASPAHPADTPLPGLVIGASPPPEQSAPSAPPSALPSPSAGPSESQVMPAVGALHIASTQCLDVDDSDNGAWTLAADCAGTDRQRWQLNRGVSDQYVIINVATGKCLAAENGSRDDGAGIVQSDCRDGAEQRWLVRAETDTFALANVNSGMCAAVEGDGKVRQRACGADAGQRWSAPA
jgi:hypothetical protein